MDDVAALEAFLRDEARLNHRILGKVVEKLQAQEVWEVDDLVHLERLPGFDECFSGVTASKIREALAR